MKCPFVGAFCAATATVLSRPTSAFGFGLVDLHAHAAPLLAQQPALLNDSAGNLVASAAGINPASGILEKYMSTLAAYPLPTKMLTGAALATAGDAIAQSREDDEYNPNRGASFAAFDMAYRASQHVLFPIIVELCRGQLLFAAMSSIGAGQLVDISQLTAMERCLASQLIIVPFLYYPVFFTFTGYMQGLDFEAGLERAKENFLPLMKRNLLFWIPVQYIQFCYIPTDLQIPFLSAAGLGWTFILSVLAGSAKRYSSDNPDHETYCVEGIEECCIIPDDELFPIIDFYDDDQSDILAKLDEVSESMSREEKNKERELLMK